MAPFLSDDWVGQLADAARSDAGLKAVANGVVLTVQQVVHRGPDDAAAWYVRFADGEVDIVPGLAHDPDVVIREELETATRVSRGELSPAEAFTSGNMKVGGRIGLLVRHQAVLARLRDALAVVHGDTTYPDA
jgi:hypothetical protein